MAKCNFLYKIGQEVNSNVSASKWYLLWIFSGIPLTDWLYTCILKAIIINYGHLSNIIMGPWYPLKSILNVDCKGRIEEEKNGKLSTFGG